MKEVESQAKIRSLGDEVINQIKAGEVVERPLSVVKELVENALDAGSDEVTVDLFDGGKTLIRVTDTGCGMSAEDARLSVVRHATSKIECVDDLESVSTFGFRGEALASVAAVSRFELRTRARGAPIGSVVMRAEPEPLGSTGAELNSADGASASRKSPDPSATAAVSGSWLVKPCAVPEGTQIEVKDLFYNTPARLKFLKSTPTEYAHIFDFLQAIAFAYPAVGLTFTHNRKRVFQYRADVDLESRAQRILGHERAGFTLVGYEKGRFGLSGLVGHPELARSVPRVFLLFVNGRLVRDKVIRAGVMQAYGGLVLKGLVPSVVLFIQCDPSWVDVNAHPSKTEVRFRDPLVLQDLVCLGLQDALHKDTQARAFSLTGRGAEQESRQPIKEPRASESSVPLRVPDGPRFQARAERAADRVDSLSGVLGFRSEQTQLARKVIPVSVLDAPPGQPSASRQTSSEKPTAAEHLLHSSPERKVAPCVARGALAGARYLGQFARCYLVLEIQKELWVVDQHAFHERILFEEYRERDSAQPIARQGLLTPLFLPVPPAVGPMLVDAGEVFERLGFETEWVPDMQALAIHSFPSFLQARVVGRVMDEVLCRVLAALEPAFACDHPLLSRAAHMRQTWSEEGRVFGSLKSDDLFHLFQATVACHSAVRSGEELHEDQVNHLLGRAADVDFAAHCPHGRPVLRKFSLQDVEAWFYR